MIQLIRQRLIQPFVIAVVMSGISRRRGKTGQRCLQPQAWPPVENREIPNQGEQIFLVRDFSLTWDSREFRRRGNRAAKALESGPPILSACPVKSL
jgi:hypothetical protein